MLVVDSFELPRPVKVFNTRAEVATLQIQDATVQALCRGGHIQTAIISAGDEHGGSSSVVFGHCTRNLKVVFCSLRTEVASQMQQMRVRDSKQVIVTWTDLAIDFLPRFHFYVVV